MNSFEEALKCNKNKWKQNTDDTVPLANYYPRTSLKELFKKWVKKNYDKPYIIMGKNEISYSYANEISCRFANALLSLGVKKGHRVALMLPNCIEYVLAFQSLLKIGAIEIPLNNRYTIFELKRIFKDSEIETVILQCADLLKIIPLLKDDASTIQRIIYIEEPNESPSKECFSLQGVFNFKDIIKRSLSTEPEVLILPEDIVRLQYTSGTTGNPKGCIYTNEMIMIQSYLTSMWWTSGFTFIKKEDVRTLCAIPLIHVYGFNSNINICLFTGGTIVFPASTKPKDIICCIQDNKPSLFATVPKMIIDLLECKLLDKADFSSLKGVYCGSAPIPKEKLEIFEKKTNVIISEGYGLSETTCTATSNPMKSMKKIGSCGIPRPMTDLLIVDIESGKKALENGKSGEIIIRGPTVIKGYWNNPEETKFSIRNNWLYTGDIGMLDDDGYLYIKDRKKNIIISSGFNVFPKEVEEVLYLLSAVLRVCVIGVTDPKRGEIIKAYIQLKENETISKDEVIEWCNKNLVSYKIPRLIEFVDDMPVNSVGKIDRRRIKKLTD